MHGKISVSPEDVGLSSDRLERVDAWMRRLVDDGKLPGVLTMVARKGQVVWLRTAGMADLARGKPVASDTIYRIYSMTKPLTSVALMMLYEQGLFQLDDPIHRFIPAWANLRVFVSGTHPEFVTMPTARPMTIRDLQTHTSGLTYGFMARTNVDA